MPCYDSRNNQPEILYVDKLQPEFNALKNKLKVLRDSSDYMEAAMCAVLSELQSRGIAEAVIAKASRHGLIDIVSWWESHRADDRARVAKEIHKYSVDEQRVILNLLKAQLGDK